MDKEEFYNHKDPADINSLPIELRYIPEVTYSFVNVVREYMQYYKTLPEEQKHMALTGGPLLVSLWAYTEISGRTISEVKKEGLLLPALALYHTVVSQDDIIDNRRRKDYIPNVKKEFWPESTTIVKIQPKNAFRFVVSMIDSNENLSKEQRLYMKRKIADGYQRYSRAEQRLFEIADSDNIDFDEVKSLRADSFGIMAEAITSVLNGTKCNTPQGEEIERDMANFSLATEMLDGLEDISEDYEMTVSVVLALLKESEHIDEFRDRYHEELLYYLDELSSPKVKTFLLFLTRIYPSIRPVLRKLSGITRSLGPVKSLGMGAGRVPTEA